MYRTVITNGRLSSCECPTLVSGVPGTLRTYEYHALALLAALNFVLFCLALFAVSLLFLFVPSLRVVVFPCLSSVKGETDAASSPRDIR